MKAMQARISLIAIAIAGTSSCASLHDGATAQDRSLLTPQQRELDELALSLLDEPAVKAARETALATWRAQPAASSADGKATLEAALDEVVYHSLRAVAAAEPARPLVAWTLAPAYSAGKRDVPGSRFAGDNPDRIYRYAAVDPGYRYEIRGQRGPAPAQHEFSFESSSSLSLVAPATVALFSRDIDVAPDGSFVVTADSTPANGRRNHLQLAANTRDVLIRDTVPDWSRDYNQVTVERLGGSETPRRSRDQLVREAGDIIAEAVRGPLFVVNQAWKSPPNQIRPFVRPSEWGVPGNVLAISRFSLQADESLVITLEPSGANYLGMQLTDPWSRSIDYWNHTSSLSDHQASANADGSFTYVLSATDPGAYNWLDTAGLRDGLILARWELFAQPLAAGAADRLVREVRLVKSGDLGAALPAGMRKVTAAERKQQLDRRAAEYARRITSR